MGRFHEGADDALRDIRMRVDEGFAADDPGVAAEARIVALRRVDDVGGAPGRKIDQIGAPPKAASISLLARAATVPAAS